MLPVFTLILCILAVLVTMVLVATLKIIRQQQVAIVERLGKFRRVLDPGPHPMVPLFDRIRYILDMREKVVSFLSQGVITEDNLIVSIDSVIYFQIADPVRAIYEAQNYCTAIEQLTMTTLCNIIGDMDLEATLTPREEINNRLRVVLDEATGKWGIKVNRIELRAIEPPPTIRDAMEKGARAERDKRVSILLAEGQCQSQVPPAGDDREAAILRAQGDREAAVLRARANRQAQMLRAEGEVQTITTVFSAIHAAEPDQVPLAYQYMQMPPRLANGDSNKMWTVPSELSDTLRGLGQAANSTDVWDYVLRISQRFSTPEPVDVYARTTEQARKDHERSGAIVKQAIADVQAMEGTGGNRRLGRPSPQPRRQDPDSLGAWGPHPDGPYDTQ